MILEEQQAELIKLHLNPSNFFDEDAVAAAAFLFTIFEDDFVKKVNKETFYLLPYKDISFYVYECGIDSIPSNTINGFATTVKDFFIKNKMCDDADHMVKCYEKFIDHILLAFAQKIFMLRVSSSALAIAQQSEEIANRASNLAGQAKQTLDTAKNTAKRAEKVASNAQRLANEASDQALETKKSSDNMMVNYVTILGIFATIIITVFGGINIIGSAVKLLEGNNKLTYLVFVVSFLMICLLTLIRTLTSWISSLNNYKEDKVQIGSPKSFYKYTISCFLFVVVIFGLVSLFTENSQNGIAKNDIKTDILGNMVLIHNETKNLEAPEQELK